MVIYRNGEPSPLTKAIIERAKQISDGTPRPVVTRRMRKYFESYARQIIDTYTSDKRRE